MVFAAELRNIDYLELVLVHAAWRRWREVRERVYRVLGVSNTEELLRSIMDLRGCKPIEDRLVQFFEALKKVVDEHCLGTAHREVRWMLSMGIEIIPFYSSRYPCELLRYRTGTDFIYPPLVLYARNLLVDPNSRPIIAVVGTRRCSEWGRRVAYELGRELASRGIVVVTGLAEGIDASAALGAVEARGYVIGVRPWLEPPSLPEESRRLVERHGDRISLVSENPFKPASSRRAVNYLYYLRNRIIAGMAKAVIVVEARLEPHSGSMHQIELALKRGKPVVIMRHPEKDSVYWRAFETYVSRGAVPVQSVEEALSTVKRLVEDRASS